MTRIEKITQYIKDAFEMYSLDYNEYFSYATENGDIIEMSLECNGKINMEMISLASQALGISASDILSMNDKAAGKWYKKYSYFFHLTGLNFAYNRTFYGEGFDAVNLLERLFEIDLSEMKPRRYDYKDIISRLYLQLEEMDKVFPGTFHKEAKITNLQIKTENFCHYDGIVEMVESFIKMVERAKKLFFKTWDNELSENEINEYNIIVSAIGLRDKCCQTAGYLYYSNLKNCIAVYKSEGYTDFFDYVDFHHRKWFEPWRCAEFVENRPLVQRYVDILPQTKKAMHEFAMKVSEFECYFVWSDATPIQWSPEEEAEMEELDEILGEEPIPLEKRAKESTIIYVPKCNKELCGDDQYVEMLLQLCRSSKLGGLSLPEHRTQFVFDIQRVLPRLGLIKNHRYEEWSKDNKNNSVGGGTNE